MKRDILDIEKIRMCTKQERIVWTEHCLNRINQRNISIPDIKRPIMTGTIIEYYYDDYPYQSCLIFGRDINNKILHLVCGMNDNIVYLITAYYPDSIKWKEDMKTRRKR